MVIYTHSVWRASIHSIHLTGRRAIIETAHLRPEQFRIDPSRPLYEQYVEQLRGRIACGDLPPGARLPSVRDFAAVMRINPTTAARTYQELERDQLLETYRGQGTFVTRDELRIDDARREIARAAVRQLRQVAASLGMRMEELLALAGNEQDEEDLTDRGGTLE